MHHFLCLFETPLLCEPLGHYTVAYYNAHVCLNIFKIYRRFDLKVVATELRISLVYVLSFNRKAKFVDKRLLFYLFIIQGEESCDFLQIFVPVFGQNG